MWALSHSDQSLTGYSDLSVSQQPNPFQIHHSKLGIHLAWQTKFKAHWVIIVMTTMHTSSILYLGITYALHHQEEQVPFTASPVITKFFIHTHPSNSVSSIIYPDFRAQHFKQPSNYPRASVLGFWASACCDHAQPYSNYISWDCIKNKMLYLHAIWMKMSVTFCPLHLSVWEPANQGSKSKAFIIFREGI